MKTKIIIMSGLLLALGVTSRAEIGDFQITFKVMDDFGKPIAGATIDASFVQTKAPLAAISAQNISEKQIDVVSDTNGLAIIKAKDIVERHIWYGIHPMWFLDVCNG